MTKLQIVMTLGIVGTVLVGTGSAGSGPATRSPQATGSASTGDLLTELRGLRAEINQAAGASLRMQLLVARLQLQEQRINTLSRQLTEVQDRLADTERAQAPLTTQLKTFTEATNNPLEKNEENFVLKTLTVQLEQLQKREQELRNQEASLVALIATEQSHWTEFNGRLDELERALTVKPPR